VNALYNPGREGILDESIKMNSGDIRAMFVKSTYVYNAADKFLSNLGAVDNGRSASLSGKNFTDGIFDAADTSLTATAAVACNAVVLFQHTGSDATARAIAYIDGRVRVEIAVAASGGATTITPEDLPDDIATAATLTKISGTGPATITTTASASAGGRSLSVSALGSNIVAGAVYEYAVAGGPPFPVTPSIGQTVSIPWSNGANKIFKV
jgi:hypothetical protein